MCAPTDRSRPMPIELSSADEMVVMDNLEIFRMNGFDFEIDEDAKTTKRVKLISYPFSQGTEFGLRGNLFLMRI